MRKILGLAIAVSLFLTVGCTQSETTTDPQPEKANKELVEIGYANLKVYDPVYVAIDNGFFNNNGLDVKIVGDNLGGPTAIQAVAGGQAQAGLSSFPAIINARGAGLPVTGVSDIQSAIGEQALETFFISKDSKIKEIKDLKGKKIAVNLMKSSFYYTVTMALEQNGLTENDVEFVLLPFDQQPEALKRGDVDMIGLMEPYTAKSVAQYDFQEFFTALDIFGEKQFTTHFINSVWAESNPEEAKAFVKSVVQAIEWIEANQADAKHIIAKYTGVEPEFVPDYHFQENGQVVIKDAQFWLEYLTKRGDLENDWLQVADFATNRYNEKVK
jgi:ABC-type nitrate/sulfonate/bicarbonate transport system substrate-binding protein